MMHDPVAIARLFLFVREAQQLGQNKGARVESIQRWSLGAPGDSYCCEFATMVLDLAFQGEAPIPRLQACEAIHQLARQHDWLVAKPIVGDLFLYVTPEGRAHHVGFVTSVDPLVGLAGNTSADGTSSNGDGVHEHPISATVFVQYPRG